MTSVGSHRERGGATIMVVTCLAMLLFVGAGLGVAVAMVASHRRAQAAADLAALAGARTVQTGGDACARAAALASDNGAELTGCTLEGESVVVTVRVTGPRWLGQTADLSAQARAGP